MMRIRKLRLPASDISVSRAFFRDVLELPADRDVIKVGWSEIQLHPSVDAVNGGVHLAFNVPYERFDEAINWLKRRTNLHEGPDGTVCFALEEPWLAKSAYFDGPDGAILELIGRRRLDVSSSSLPFCGADLSCLSEIGLPTENVDGLVAETMRTFGIAQFGQPSSRFAAIGDDEALLIAVDPNRPWFAGNGQLPGARGVEVTLDCVAMSGVVTDPSFGWKIQA